MCDSEGRFVKKLCENTKLKFKGPRGLAFDCKRNQLYVADENNNTIQVFNSYGNGQFMRKIGSMGQNDGV